MAIGTQEDLKMGVGNEESGDGYFSCLGFLGRYARGERIRLGAKLIVVGGGNAAVDAARSALRCGATEVTIIVWEMSTARVVTCVGSFALIFA